MKEQVLTILDKSRKYTMAVAEAMPEDGYSFKPVESVWNFGELMSHLAYGIEWWGNNFIAGKNTEWAPPPAKEQKELVLSALRDAYAELEKVIAGIPLSEDTSYGFHSTLDHVTHHRGQAVVYLRMKGITPPEYIY